MSHGGPKTGPVIGILISVFLIALSTVRADIALDAEDATLTVVIINADDAQGPKTVPS